jgi:outer membrane protein assembly factor BamE (lipoprotein component of BamABCDE complex)
MTGNVEFMAFRCWPAVAAVALSLGTLGACSPTTNIRGYLMDEQLVQSIQPGVDNQESIRAMLGNPSVEALFERNRWYYVSRTTETLAFFHPETVDHKVLAVEFDDRGYVTAVNRFGPEEVRDVSPVGGKTPTRGRELGFWEQIFGNIGRFSGGGAAGP